MLEPGIQTVLTEALRPPAGATADAAVATTYSLHLTAMLLAPLTFAQAEADSVGDALGGDPLILLEAVQRHVDEVTVFVQAGGIAVPTNHSRIHTFLEDSVVQVGAPNPDGLFHPKVWAVRYLHQDGRHHHRLLIGSRNLTLDDSWDTLLVLDQAIHGTVDGGPAEAFLRALPEMALSPLSAERRTKVLSLAAGFGRARFDVPAPFEAGQLLPLGIPGGTTWDPPASDRITRALAVSPFITPDQLSRFRPRGGSGSLVSRAEQLDVLTGSLNGWVPHVMHDQLVLSVPNERPSAGEPRAADTETTIVKTGLHAKALVLDLRAQRQLSTVITGSANLTRAAWERNVEFNAVLTGPTPDCGVEAVLGVEDNSRGGLDRVLEAYEPQKCDQALKDAIANEHALERHHRRLAQALPELHASRPTNGRLTATLTVSAPEAPAGSTTAVRLLTQPMVDNRPLTGEIAWSMAPKNLTPFLVVESSMGQGAARVTRRCMITVTLTGHQVDRRISYLEELLDSERAVLRYLAMLLGTQEAVALDVAETTTSTLDVGTTGPLGSTWDDVVLFEPLMRAAAAGHDHLAPIAAQIAMLRSSERIRALLPESFEQVWATVLDVVAPDLLTTAPEVTE